ncbi:MAG TPA: hypothetical protein VLQ89_08435, partial [Candidatus Binatia bacterium]|nr:hypothetical protein [Candidatus Binatia bacterium]
GFSLPLPNNLLEIPIKINMTRGNAAENLHLSPCSLFLSFFAAAGINRFSLRGRPLTLFLCSKQACRLVFLNWLTKFLLPLFPILKS